jgi:hypothetical protein
MRKVGADHHQVEGLEMFYAVADKPSSFSFKHKHDFHLGMEVPRDYKMRPLNFQYIERLVFGQVYSLKEWLVHIR